MTTATWRPTVGAWPAARGFHFRVWAPEKERVILRLEAQRGGARKLAMEAEGGSGWFAAAVDEAEPGDRYGYVVDGAGPFPDPASRWQPDGVHDASALVDPHQYVWHDAGWRGLPWSRAVIYELHVGAFSEAGTFAGAATKLPALVDLGVNAIELMPVADFPGARNWGYDGVSLFAPARAYGTPDDLRRLVDDAHRLGLAVLLDVVYNHFGPDGAYGGCFSPYYFSTRHSSPWGAAVNLDDARSDDVRGWLIENALHWLHEYHFDGLRLDATHAMVDTGPVHFCRQLARHVRASIDARRIWLVAEDERNLSAIVRPDGDGGWGFDAVWADDFHHQARVATAGDRDGYFLDFSGSAADIATTIRRGWFFCGQPSGYLGRPRGDRPDGVPLERMVICLQNHDQVGNRAFGERLHHQIAPEVWRAASALLLLAPETPLLFMGQEWAATSPFLYFTDHNPELGRLVTEGRRREFARFAAFAAADARERIPDPQAGETFAASRLRWQEREAPTHARALAWHRALLDLRRRDPALAPGGTSSVAAAGDDALLLARTTPGSRPLLVVVRLRSAGAVDIARVWPEAATRRWTTAITSGDAAFAGDEGRRPRLDDTGHLAVVFEQPGAIVLRAEDHDAD
jgi:maltooligosyltrehalose trehalohydrolase